MNKLRPGLNQCVIAIATFWGLVDGVERTSIDIHAHVYVFATDIKLPNGYKGLMECFFAPDEDEFADLNTLLGHKNAPTP